MSKSDFPRFNSPYLKCQSVVLATGIVAYIDDCIKRSRQQQLNPNRLPVSKATTERTTEFVSDPTPDAYRTSILWQRELERLENLYTGIKPYPCECGDRYAGMDALILHKLRNICIGGHQYQSTSGREDEGRSHG